MRTCGMTCADVPRARAHLRPVAGWLAATRGTLTHPPCPRRPVCDVVRPAACSHRPEPMLYVALLDGAASIYPEPMQRRLGLE